MNLCHRLLLTYKAFILGWRLFLWKYIPYYFKWSNQVKIGGRLMGSVENEVFVIK